jgi:hypothetical protein
MIPSRYLASCLGALLIPVLFFMAGCGKPQLDVVEVEPASTTVTVGKTVQFQAIARDTEGNPMDDVSVTWSAEGESGRIDAQGRLEALAPGAVTVTATAEGGIAGTARVTVERQQAAALVASASPSQVQVDQQSSLTVTVQNAAGEGLADVPVHAQVAPEAATIQPASAETNADGKASFRLTAAPQVTANQVQFRADQASTTITVQGLAGPPASLQLSELPTSVTAGEQVHLQLQVRDAHDNPVPQSPVEVSALSPETSVTPAQLETDAQGQAEITIHTQTHVGDNRLRLAVAGLPPRELVVQGVAGAPGQLAVQTQPTQTVAGGTATVSVRVQDTHGNPVADVPVRLQVTPSAASLEQDQLTTDDHGLARTVLHTALEPGDNTVRAQVAKLDAVQRTVVGNTPVALQLRPHTATVEMLGSVQFRAQVVDELGNAADVVPTWKVVGDSGTMNADGTYTAARLGHDVVLATFAGLNAGAQLEVIPGKAAVVEITPKKVTVVSGMTQQFEATAYNAHRYALDIPPTWKVHNDIGTVDRSGLFTALKAGEGAVVATVDEITGRAQVTVTPGALKAITVEPSHIEVQAGEEVQLQAHGRDAAGNEIPIDPTWNLTADLGDLDASGVFRAARTGSGRLIVEAGTPPITTSIPVRVHAAALARLDVDPHTLTLRAGDAYQFSATGYDRFGNPVPVSPAWALSEELGSIDADGYLRVEHVGRAQVQATVDSLTSQASLIVKPAPLASLATDPAGPLTLAAGDTIAFTVTGYDAYGNVVTVTPTWSQEPALGSLTAEGFFRAQSVGTTELMAQSDSVAAAVQVTITPGKLARIAVTPSEATMTAGDKASFGAAGFDAYDNEVNIQPGWRVEGNIGELTAPGAFTALQANTGAIVASAQGVSGQAQVTVEPGALTFLEVTPDDLSLSAGETAEVVVAGYDTLGNPVPVQPTWHVDDQLGTVTPGGVLTAQKAGKGRLVVAVEHLAAVVSLQVTPGEAASLRIAPATYQLVSGDQHTFTVQGFDLGGNRVPVDPAWEVEGAIGTIDPEGRFTATQAGSGTVVATVDSLRVAATVQVTPGVVTELRVTPESASLVAGERLELHAEAFDAAGNRVPTRPMWTVTNHLGVVDSEGIFHARKAGAGQLVASIGDVQQAVGVQVEAGPLATVSLVPAKLVISAGGELAFTATGADAFGNPVSVEPTWGLQGTVGRIDPEQGLFKATHVGSGTIAAVAGAIAGTASVHVEPGAASRLQVTPRSVTLAAGEETAFRLTAYDAFDNVTSADVTWSLSKPFGRLDRNHFKAERAGATEVIASTDDVKTRAQLHIRPGPLVRLEVEPTQAVVPAGETREFRAFGYDAYGNRQEVAAVWEFAGNIGHLDADGHFTAATRGTGRLTARFASLSSQAEVRVTPSQARKLTITPAHVQMQAGASQRFTVTAYDAGGNVRDVTVRWALTADVGRLDQSGTFTALHAGRGTVVAYSGGMSATAEVEVLPGPVALIFVNPRLSTVAAGKTIQFEAKGFDAYRNQLPSIAPRWEIRGNVGTIDPESGAFTATQTGWGKVQAVVQDLQGTADVEVTHGSPDARQSRLVASRARLPADGKTAAKIIILVRDRYGNPVPEASVTLVSNRDDLIEQPVPSNQQGIATGSIRSKQPGTAVVHAVIEAQRLTTTLRLTFLEPGVSG